MAANVVGASVGFAGNPQAVHAFLDSSLYMDKKIWNDYLFFFLFLLPRLFPRAHIPQQWARYFGISRVTAVRYESRVIYQTHSPIWSLYTKLGSKPDTVALLDFYTSEGYLIFPSPQA